MRRCRLRLACPAAASLGRLLRGVLAGGRWPGQLLYFLLVGGLALPPNPHQSHATSSCRGPGQHRVGSSIHRPHPIPARAQAVVLPLNHHQCGQRRVPRCHQTTAHHHHHHHDVSPTQTTRTGTQSLTHDCVHRCRPLLHPASLLPRTPPPPPPLRDQSIIYHWHHHQQVNDRAHVHHDASTNHQQSRTTHHPPPTTTDCFLGGAKGERWLRSKIHLLAHTHRHHTAPQW